MNKIPLYISVVLAGLALVLSGSVYVVTEGQQALKLRFGKIITVKTEPGLYFKRPFVLEDIIYQDKRLQIFDLQPREVIFGDSKRMVVDAIARFKIVQPLEFYQRAQNVEQLSSLLDPILDSNLREELGRATIEDVLSARRDELMENTASKSSASTKALGIEIIDVRIVRADLPTTNTENVVRRMIAEREREAREERAQGRKTAEEISANADRDSAIILAEATKKSEILRGEGEAERNRIFAEAFSRDPEFFEFYRSMQAYRKSLNQDDTSLVLSPDSEFFRYFGNDEGKR